MLLLPLQGLRMKRDGDEFGDDHRAAILDGRKHTEVGVILGL